MQLIFEKSQEGRACNILPPPDVPIVNISEENKRKSELNLPQLSEICINRHYTKLAKRVYGVNNGFYPLGSCTMKYNPSVNESAAALPGFTQIHPLQPQNTVQGCLEAIYNLEQKLCKITGMDNISFAPAAGAHGEFLGLLLIKAYHESRGDIKRKKIIVPDSAHGTNPATAKMAGFEIINIKSKENGCIDLEVLEAAVNQETAGLMLTNPNTLGLFEKDILKITKIIHKAGGLVYYDGANLNAIMGIVRPGDMGFDVVHLNLHKTFSTPHGGGGPGSGPVGCKAFLADFLPNFYVQKQENKFEFSFPQHSVGMVKSFYGNFLVMIKALTYILTLGEKGIREAAQNAVLNANYLKHKLTKVYDAAHSGLCMHEFVLSLENLKKEYGVCALDVAKMLLDRGIHPPTMYFPLIVHEALMFEPTETEAKENLDEAVEVLLEIYDKAKNAPEVLRKAPVCTPVGRLDEVLAARSPKLKYEF